MSSISRSPQNTSQGDAYFVNITPFLAQHHALDASGQAIPIVGINYSSPYASGAMLLRDMGKTIRVPGQTLDATWVGPRVLRKVQYIGQSNTRNFPVTNGFTDVNEGVSGVADSNNGPLPTGFATFYIDLASNGSNVYNVAPCRFARLSV
jgi:hypothetical protein